MFFVKLILQIYGINGKSSNYCYNGKQAMRGINVCQRCCESDGTAANHCIVTYLNIIFLPEAKAPDKKITKNTGDIVTFWRGRSEDGATLRDFRIVQCCV